MSMTDSYIDVLIGDVSHRIQIKHEERPCDAYIAVDEQQISTKLKMLPYNGGVHFFEIDGHRLALVISRNGPESSWEYDCFLDDQSVVNGMPFWFGKADLVAVKQWEKNRRGGKLNYWMMSCAKGALIGCAIFLLLFVGGWIGRMEITWIHLLVSVLPLVVLYAIFVPFEWKNNEKSYAQYRAILAGTTGSEEGEADGALPSIEKPEQTESADDIEPTEP